MVRPVTTNELRSLEACWRVGDITEGDLHSVADSLLAKGEDHEALIDLFVLDRAELRWRGADAFETLLRAWGGGTMKDDEAVRIFMREIASDVVAGTITPLEATRRADAINRRTDYRYAEPLEWADFYEELEYLDSSGLSYLGRDRASIEADIMALAPSTLAS
jgi:hypothetical protein